MRLLLLALVLLGCDSAGNAGEPCSVPGGANGVCDDNLVCGRARKDGNFSCIPICFEEKQCPKELHCKEVEKSKIKACIVD